MGYPRRRVLIFSEPVLVVAELARVFDNPLHQHVPQLHGARDPQQGSGILLRNACLPTVETVTIQPGVRTRPDTAPLRIGIGISTGQLTLGTIGGSARIKCGVIGDPVNLASQVETITKSYGVPFLISDHTYDALPEAAREFVRLVDVVLVVGRLAPVSLYEVFAADPPALREAKAGVAEGCAEARRKYLARDFDGAVAAYEACEAALPDDRVVRVHLQRSREYRESPPGAEWTGVAPLAHK